MPGWPEVANAARQIERGCRAGPRRWCAARSCWQAARQRPQRRGRRRRLTIRAPRFLPGYWPGGRAVCCTSGGSRWTSGGSRCTWPPVTVRARWVEPADRYPLRAVIPQVRATARAPTSRWGGWGSNLRRVESTIRFTRPGSATPGDAATYSHKSRCSTNVRTGIFTGPLHAPPPPGQRRFSRRHAQERAPGRDQHADPLPGA